MNDKEDSSYDNDLSNVARLWECYAVDKRLYLEGIGTEDRKKDDDLGYAMGTGKTGVRAKVEKACEQARDRIKEQKEKQGAKEIGTLTHFKKIYFRIFA